MEIFLNPKIILVSNFSVNTYVVVFIRSILLLKNFQWEQETCVKRPLKNRQNKDLNNNW